MSIILAWKETIMNTHDRAIASFLGLAIGDALGAPVEFKEPGEFDLVTDYRHSYVWNIPPGFWTDDTSMALCLAESILARNTVDPQDLLERFGRWYRLGENSATGRCFDIGTTTRSNIERFLKEGQTQAPDVHYQSGNGGIMRLSPVAIRWWHNTAWAAQMAEVQSKTTHGSTECVACATELATILTRAIQGHPVHSELQADVAHMKSKLSNSGRASDTLLAAKWCVATTHSFETAVLQAVNMGGDADTIGAVTGQIAGAVYGVADIPTHWLTQLHDVQRLTDLAEQLYWNSAE
jgi:ADP-ribosyl-[dinitrogen reductase] hydrolase